MEVKAYMIVSIDSKSNTAIYEQLKAQIISGILRNDLKEGEQLPSVRQLSGDLEINMHTVSKAYKLLENQGFIKISKKKGAFIHWDIKALKITYEKEALLKEVHLQMMLYKHIYGNLEDIKKALEKMEVEDE